MRISKHMSRVHLAGLNKIGNVLLPGFGELPSFSESGAVADVDRVLDYMPRADRKDLSALLMLTALLPNFLVRILIKALEYAVIVPGPVGGQLRFIRLGIRGLVFTLYYAQPLVHEELGFKISVYTDDLAKT